MAPVAEDTTARSGLSKIAWSHDGTRVAAIGDRGAVLVWSVADLPTGPESYQGQAGRMTDLAWHRGGSMLATASDEGSVRIWGVPGGKRIVRIVPKTQGAVTGPVTALAWKPTGQSLVYGVVGANTVRVLDLATAVESSLKPLWIHDGDPAAIAWSAEAHSVAIGGAAGLLQLGRADLPRMTGRLFEGEEPLISLNWSPDSVEVACLDREGVVRTFGVADGILHHTLRVGDAEEADLLHAWSGGGAKIASVRVTPSGSQVTILDPRADGTAQSLDVPGFQATAAAWGKGRGDLWLASADGRVMRYDLEGRPTLPFESSGAGGSTIRRIIPSPDHNFILACGEGGHVSVWSVRDGGLVLDAVGTDSSTGASFACWHPSGERFATLSGDGLVSIWSMQDKRIEQSFKAHRRRAGAIAWHPQGERIATGGLGDSRIRVWDWETKEAVLTLAGLRGGIRDLAWGADGRCLAAVSGNGSLQIWDATAGILLGSGLEE